MNVEEIGLDDLSGLVQVQWRASVNIIMSLCLSYSEATTSL